MEDESKLAVLQSNINAVSDMEVRLKRLCAAVIKAAVAERPRQLGLLTKAKEYVADIQRDAPRLLSSKLKVVANEVNSLYDGAKTQSIPPKEFTLKTGFALRKEVSTMKASFEQRLKEINAELPDQTQHTIQKLEKFKKNLPDLTKKPFGFARVPVVFSFVNKQGHSSVGFSQKEILDHLGFKSDQMDGYAVIHSQVVLGLTSAATHDIVEEIDLEDNAVRNVAKPKMVTERVSKFTGGKPGMVVRRRPKTMLDAGQEYCKLLSEKTGIDYSIVSERTHSYHGASYFWLMPARDLNRFSKAFPGGHAKVSSWGFAFN